jgi:misacylated tRNA(Ala) deacylase
MLQLTSNVKRCEAGTLSTLVNGKKTKLAGFNVVLEDTVLFPEGGGQVNNW